MSCLKQTTTEYIWHLNTSASLAGACSCAELAGVQCRSCLALLQSLCGFPAVFHIPYGADQNFSAESSSKGYRKEDCNKITRVTEIFSCQTAQVSSVVYRLTGGVPGLLLLDQKKNK